MYVRAPSPLLISPSSNSLRPCSGYPLVDLFRFIEFCFKTQVVRSVEEIRYDIIIRFEQSLSDPAAVASPDCGSFLVLYRPSSHLAFENAHLLYLSI